MEDRVSWLECILKRKTFNEAPIRVTAVETGSSVVGKGENYLSKLERLKGTVLLGSGKTKRISLIIKNQLETDEMQKVSQELGVFFREITMYRDILPKMEDLLDEINDSEGIIWGRCYDYRLYDRIVFEDLAAVGYKMVDRKKQLGLESALMSIKAIAKFHALSKLLLERGEIPMDLLGKPLWVKEPAWPVSCFTENAQKLVAKMRNWGDEWQVAADKLSKSGPELGKRVIEELTHNPEEFLVLCHGDCWSNNMLYKGEDLENPDSVKLVDMQTVAVTSPAFDFHLLVGASVRPDVIREHYDTLIAQYVETLASYLTLLGFKGPIPSLEEFKGILAKKSVFMLGWALILGIVVTNDMSGHPFEEDTKKEAEGEAPKDPPPQFDPFEKLNEESVNMYKICLEKSIEYGLI